MVELKLLFPYDVEPIQKYMDAFVEGEMFEATEKIHGTQLVLSLLKVM